VVGRKNLAGMKKHATWDRNLQIFYLYLRIFFFFALDMGKMISFVVSHIITVFPYCIMGYCHLRFEVDISDYE
jgi:hypothetical protein